MILFVQKHELQGAIHMEFDYRKLRQRIREQFETEEEFARALGITNVALSRKLRNEGDFTRGQMVRAAALLGLEAMSIPEYFFVEKVQKNEFYVEYPRRGGKSRSGYIH